MNARNVSRGILAFTVGSALVVAAACSSPSKKGPDFTSVAELNSLWKLNGTYSFLCNGAAEHISITNANVYVFNGVFDTTLFWPTAVCGSSGVTFNGVVNLDGSISGNVATNGGGSTLSDTLAGSCSTASCSGNSANTGEFTFTMANTGANPFDGPNWTGSVQCSDGGGVSVSANVSQGASTAATVGYTLCTSTGHVSITSGTPVPETFTVTVTAAGAFSASLTQGTADTLTFTTTFTDLTGTGSTAGFTGTDGARLQLARATPN